ncbi:Na+/H+ antiporter NhaA [Angustibacter luteus]|uniref:Na(+)/H(+) antiporter NhaA n=1 Tax=Angustibacter luteus TaxID=658456 RepID=A0ABW1JCL5_9ACTN
MSSPAPRRFLTRPSSWPEARFVADALRAETVGGMLLLAAAVIAMVWANSPWRDGYLRVQTFKIGPEALDLHISLAHWASDGLLAVFFLVAGLELKRELVVGDLSDVQRAILPVVAAICGVVVPALFYLAVVAGVDGAGRGWAVPTATDIAFALAALAVLGSHLPSALRSFLLTLAVVDDLIAITIIAVFYTDDLKPLLLLGSAVPLVAFWLVARRRVAPWWLLVPLGLATWTMVHASGVHATVAGMALAFTVPVRPHEGDSDSRAEHVEHAIRPLSAGFCVPVFALLASGVTLVGGGLGDAVSDRVTWAVVVALVAGKLVGVFGGTFLTARLTRAQLDDDLAWGDVLGLSLLGGIGFTVSLLVGELAFEDDPARHAHVKLGVLIASVLAALLAAVVLRRRERAYRTIAERDSRDDDGDGVPDVYQPGRG